MCRVFSVSRSGFYKWRNARDSQKKRADHQLIDHIRRIHYDSDRSYGSPRITAALRQQGLVCNHKRVARLMRINGIRSKIKRKFKVTTRSNHNQRVAPNLVNRNFVTTMPDRLWTSDITYIWTREGWLYLAIFLDACTRRVVGWSMSHRLTDALIAEAFKQAQRRRQPKSGLIVHSDRGSQYCSQRFKELLTHGQFKQSMSSTGNCYDNAITESFFGTLKTELVYDRYYRTRSQARKSIFKYIEIFYNRRRIHSAINNMPPVQFEKMNFAA